MVTTRFGNSDFGLKVLMGSRDHRESHAGEGGGVEGLRKERLGGGLRTGCDGVPKGMVSQL